MKLDEKVQHIKDLAELDLVFFINLVHPHRVLGDIHKELISWWTRQDAKTHQLALLPRDHGKSAMIAYRVAWHITRNPASRIIYISSTSGLAVKQLKFIKDILTSKIYRRYWPEMVNEEESKREKWTETEISVDHPKRAAETVRDSTIFTAGLTTGITGLHCDVAVFDDVVVRENAVTEDGRAKVEAQVSLLASIQGADGQVWAVGTRYHPLDLYNTFMSTIVETFDGNGNIQGADPLYETFEREVEDRGDGTGSFLWPRMQRKDGIWFGFNAEVLAKKKAQYHDKTQFRAQYYNDPNDASSSPINPELFQYYNPKLLDRRDGYLLYNGRRLNVFAGVDFAFSLAKRADYTAVVVVGIDHLNNYYVLDIERFKTDRITEYFDTILRLHQKWGFRRLRAETTVAQQVIVRDIKENYVKPLGLSLIIEDHRPTAKQGNKEERIAATLYPKYENRQIYHFKGGNCSILEEELVQQNPAHDDVKDCLTIAVDCCVAPTFSGLNVRPRFEGMYNQRFGGIQ